MDVKKILGEAEDQAANRASPFCWRELFGDDRWEKLSEGKPKQLGEALSKGVKSGYAPSLEAAGIAKSGRMNLYRKKKT